LTRDTPRSLGGIVDAIERRRKRVTVYAPTLPQWFEDTIGDSHAEVRHYPVPADALEPFVTVRRDGQYHGSVRLAALAPVTGREIWGPGDRRHLEAENEQFRAMLADTVFSSLDRRALVAAAREIEDRAWRVGEGELHVCFQSLSALRDQADVYATLSWRKDLFVHVYGRPDWSPLESLSGLYVHETEDPRLTGYWVVAYDGGGDERQKCALVAEQTGDGIYAGFWTYDAGLVDDVLAILRRVAPAADRGAEGADRAVGEGSESEAVDAERDTDAERDVASESDADSDAGYDGDARNDADSDAGHDPG
jgi:DICT domain-containing protein